MTTHMQLPTFDKNLSLVVRLELAFRQAKKEGFYRRNPNASKKAEDTRENAFRAQLLTQIIAQS